jgi:hypothetical protein
LIDVSLDVVGEGAVAAGLFLWGAGIWNVKDEGKFTRDRGNWDVSGKEEMLRSPGAWQPISGFAGSEIIAPSFKRS